MPKVTPSVVVKMIEKLFPFTTEGVVNDPLQIHNQNLRKFASIGDSGEAEHRFRGDPERHSGLI